MTETDYLKPAELAVRWKVTVGSLAQARYLGTGCRFLKLGKGTVRYRMEDVEAFEAASLRTSTSGAA